MKKLLGAIALLGVFCTCSNAGLVGIDQAQSVGLNFIHERIERGDADRAVTAGRCSPLYSDGHLIGYHLPLRPRGHLILSPLTEMPPIKAYSFECDFDPDLEVGYTALIRDVLRTTLTFLTENYGDLNDLPAEVDQAGNRSGWARLLTGERSLREEITVGPILTSSWHQSGPYNDDCPTGDGGTCVVGCVATSGAQILHYWKYPPNGEGQHSYTWAGDTSCGGHTGGGVLTAVFADDYSWESILDSYNAGYTEAQARAVAELNYEMGVACNMDYGVCGSGASGSIIDTIYTDYFRFAGTVEHIDRGLHSAEEWFARIRGEMDALPPRPMHYLIHTHSIICDGYRIQDGLPYYHMNYGWGGSQNVWFALDNVYCPWTGCNYMSESMAVGLEPLGYFQVPAPAVDVLNHGEPLPEVHWIAAPGDSVTIALYRGNELVTLLTGKTLNDGSEQPLGVVQSAWGTGARYRIKVVSDNGFAFGWSADFGIYGVGAWVDVAEGALADDGNGQSVAWGDFDGDGLVDLYLANSEQSNHLLRNLGDGEFDDVTTAPLAVVAHSRGAAWADIDNDDDLDLYLACTANDANHLFRNDGTAFVDIGTGLLSDTAFSMDPAWGDYDGDGLVDLYCTNVYAADWLLHNDGEGLFSDATTAPLGDGGYCRSANWCDYDDDGHLDLLLITSAGGTLYHNLGDGFQVPAGLPLGAGYNAFGGAWADMDNDGDQDLYLGVNGSNRLLRNDGEGNFVDISSGILGDAGNCRGVAWGDFDNDGLLDLYVVNQGENILLRNGGAGVFTNSTDMLLGDPGDGNAAAWADMDNDGDLDLYLVNGDGPNRLFRNDLQNGHHWLQLNLRGNGSNHAAIGARVTLWSGGVMQNRQVGGDAGYASFNSLRVEFGLGGAAVVDSVRVEWPGGGIQLITNPEIDRCHEIEEGEMTAVAEMSDPPFRLAANYPNPFNPATEIRFNLPRNAVVRLAIYDLQGGLVSTLIDGVDFENGDHSCMWTGRDDSGHPVASGVYFCHLSAGGGEESRKMTLLK
ncbi:MAG: hypothetical protein GY835_18935 [bacterium]|nr:hypothetical protein [bacterium]